jgi:hypothetical protein
MSKSRNSLLRLVLDATHALSLVTNQFTDSTGSITFPCTRDSRLNGFLDREYHDAPVADIPGMTVHVPAGTAYRIAGVTASGELIVQICYTHSRGMACLNIILLDVTEFTHLRLCQLNRYIGELAQKSSNQPITRVLNQRLDEISSQVLNKLDLAS